MPIPSDRRSRTAACGPSAVFAFAINPNGSCNVAPHPMMGHDLDSMRPTYTTGKPTGKSTASTYERWLPMSTAGSSGKDPSHVTRSPMIVCTRLTKCTNRLWVHSRTCSCEAPVSFMNANPDIIRRMVATQRAKKRTIRTVARRGRMERFCAKVRPAHDREAGANNGSHSDRALATGSNWPGTARIIFWPGRPTLQSLLWCWDAAI